MHSLALDPSLRASMGLAAREHYLKHFSPDSVLLTLLNTYRRLASAGALQARADDRCAPVVVDEGVTVAARSQ